MQVRQFGEGFPIRSPPWTVGRARNGPFHILCKKQHPGMITTYELRQRKVFEDYLK
jgi:hypothetical protein